MIFLVTTLQSTKTNKDQLELPIKSHFMICKPFLNKLQTFVITFICPKACKTTIKFPSNLYEAVVLQTRRFVATY